MRVFTSLDDLTAAVGESIGPGPWRQVEQSRVDLFAEATDDHQWIHVDPVRAASGPFGGTVAHGYLTLSLLPALAGQLYRVEGIAMGVNYGLNRVRFPAPLRVGTAVRATATIAEVSQVSGGVQLVMAVAVEAEGGAKPVCVAETISRLYPRTDR
ncbi:MaoC family dehydratase [Micromonospora profundi]|uniref:MaoC family dehydratase n=1 Tax=Micromonospora profundi TaxID=1420889 RepID=A0AAJ6HQP6_9ACTN|nr:MULTISPECIES: MaoC family dehydratase [Micromonospora]KOX09894.1 dehydratase [Micromonospora sp. NRRL B-16802]NJC12588.1 acyl dehydratase [Micromonospora profundi]WLS44427.1 MaoC family dehydratase [Micromonospora profundi]